ncbi:MAG TPA: hypothetical protein VFQ97_00455 [Gallionella sp.]|nr:hypothetical protein [Gallionella sp.]
MNLRKNKLRNQIGIVAAICLTVMPLQVHAAETNTPGKANVIAQPAKGRLVLMPLRVAEGDKSLQGAMETALVEGLQQKYEVYSGEQVLQKAREIFLKESRSTAKKDCDETRCMQEIAEAFQAELIATANITKREDGYFLALSIQNIFDNKVIFSKSLPCRNCDAYQVVEQLKVLVRGSDMATMAKAPAEAPVVKPSDVHKDRLVVMPLRVREDERGLLASMETALTEGLQEKYEVFSGERVAQKAKEIFNKESQAAKKDCDETRCMQDVAMAFQAELIAVANVSKRDGGYFLTISIQNIFDNKTVYSKNLACKNCDEFQLVSRFRELVGATSASSSAPNSAEMENDLWKEVQKGNTREDYTVYLDKYPNGRYSALAEARIGKAVSSRTAESALWAEAQKGNSEEKYRAYLSQFPNGKYAGTANARIEKYKRDAA